MANSQGKTAPIIVKRVKKGGHAGHHGGAWKIAYADFITAMMAFFLLMWLLGSTARGDLQGIAAYFQNPLKVAMQGGSGSGDSHSVIKGGGSQLAKDAGNRRRGDAEADRRNFNLEALRAQLRAEDERRMREIRQRIEKAVDARPALRALKNQLRMEITPDGLRVQIVDDQGRPMFDSGSARSMSFPPRLMIASAGGSFMPDRAKSSRCKPPAVVSPETPAFVICALIPRARRAASSRAG